MTDDTGRPGSPGGESEATVVRGRWARLGLPGLVDLHVHFLPPRVLAKVWAFFDALREPDGTPAWPVRYRGDDDERLRLLRAFGVRAFPTLCYPHKPDSWYRPAPSTRCSTSTRTPGCAGCYR